QGVLSVSWWSSILQTPFVRSLGSTVCTWPRLHNEQRIHQAGCVERTRGRRWPRFHVRCLPVTCLCLLQSHQRE
ncbi:hypothetical protein JOQ06_026682, partial [Pogonophryne albipinna]